MRIPAWVLTFALVACTTVPAPGPSPVVQSGNVFDQGWSAEERESFATTPQGSYLMPLAWFTALRRTDVDAPFLGDRLARYGYLPGSGALPLGFVPQPSEGQAYVGMSCAACHTGQLNIKGVAWRIDGGRGGADFQAFLTDLGGSATATVNEPARFTAFAGEVLGPNAADAAKDKLRADLADWTGRYTGFMAKSLPSPAWGPGRLDAFGMIFNRVVGLDLGGPFDPADAPVRYPFIWDAPRQDRTQWTGAAPNGTYLRALARNTGEVFGVFGRLDPKPLPLHTALYTNAVNFVGLQSLEEKLVRLRAPKWPADLPLDAALAAEGKPVFASECAGCHGLKSSGEVSNAWVTPLKDVGTDPLTFAHSRREGAPGVLLGTRQPPFIGTRLVAWDRKDAILANAVIGSLLKAAIEQDPAIRRAINQDILQNRLPLVGGVSASDSPAATVAAVTTATKDLYKGNPATVGGVYEARVLTGIWAVAPYLHNGSVASLRELLTPPEQRLRRFAVGHRDFDAERIGLETAAGPGRTMFVVDAAVGNGNGGHAYGTALPEPAKRALLEYLKTL